MTDFLVQKLPDRALLYHQDPGIWYSTELNRWMVTAPDLIRQAMYDDAFAVPSYDVSPVTRKLGIDLHYLQELRRWFPLAAEGEVHKLLRERFARQIAQNSAAALSALEMELNIRAAELDGIAAGTAFCFYGTVLRPALMRVVCGLANAELPAGLPMETIPQLFDDAISPTRRRRINTLLEDIFRQLPSSWDSDQKYLSCGIIALSANTLLGSVSLTFLQALQNSPTKCLSDVAWGADLARTGLPLIEKKVIRDTALGPVQLSKGSRVRLFIESEGVLPGDRYQYSDLFFAVGSHRCVGMSVSRQVWTKLAQFLSGIDRRISLLEVAERTGDYVFNYPDKIWVCFDG
jgi:cytochrome P450